MRKNLGAKPYLLPMPVLIIATYDTEGKPNAMNAAWGCITDVNEISISMSPHKTTDNILLKKAFTVSLADKEHAAACDYVGLVSGKREPDKMKKSGFHTTKSAFVDAPLIDELPFSLECRFKSFEDGIMIGEIVNISVDERILTDGVVDLNKFNPITYDPIHQDYRELGGKVADAFSVGKTLK